MKGLLKKSSACLVMSEAQKRQTIHAVENALDRLGGSMVFSTNPSLLSTNALIYEANTLFRFADRQEYLLKGYFQSHKLALFVRLWQIDLKAEDIAAETGAKKREVKAELEEWLSQFLDPIG